jgi:uncharacterized SAM-binding protein YcdF (DUF218 family)
MIYYASKVFWLIAAPINALVLISAIAAFWAALRSPNRVAWLAAAAACGVVIAMFTPIGIALTVPLEYRFAFSPPDSQAAPDGIILLGGGGISGLEKASVLSQNYPKARLIFTGFGATTSADDLPLKLFAFFGGDPARIYMESRSRTTFEDALYAAALLNPKPSERWLLLTSAMHMPRAVGSFRAAGFRVEPYPTERMDLSHPFADFVPGISALNDLNKAAKEWIGLITYRLMGKTDALFPGP